MQITTHALYLDIHKRMCVCVRVYVSVFVRIHMSISVYLCACVCICMCVCVCMHIYNRGGENICPEAILVSDLGFMALSARSNFLQYLRIE